MNKGQILKTLLLQLEQLFDDLKASAQEARDAATNEESKAENKYDTRGLEASYLAGAQAERAVKLVEAITHLKKIELLSFNQGDQIKVSALTELETDKGENRYFFILPHGGGNKITHENKEVRIITPTSPLGSKLIGKFEGDSFKLKTKSETIEYEITKIY